MNRTRISRPLLPEVSVAIFLNALFPVLLGLRDKLWRQTGGGKLGAALPSLFSIWDAGYWLLICAGVKSPTLMSSAV